MRRQRECRVYKIGSKGEWRQVESRSVHGELTANGDVGVTWKLRSGDIGPSKPTSVMKFDADSGKWTARPLDDATVPRTDPNVLPIPDGYQQGDHYLVAWYLDAKDLPPAKCPKQNCETQQEFTMRGWVTEL